VTVGREGSTLQTDVNAVYVVEEPTETAMTDADWVVAATAGGDAVETLLDADEVNCVVVDARAETVPDVGTVVEYRVPVVAVVRDDAGGIGAFEAGAAEVYRCSGGDPDPSLLERRAASAVRSLPSGTGDPDAGAVQARQQRLERLVATTREMMAAETVEEVMDVAGTAAADVLEFPGAGVRQYRPTEGTLESVSVGSTVGEMGDRSTFDVDGTPHGRAFREGRTVVEDIGEDDPYDRDPFVQTMYVPIGDWGVLSAGRTARPFDETDVRLAKLLATTTEAALDSARREETLVRHREVLDAVAGMVFAVEDAGKFTLVTDPFAAALGTGREPLVGEHVSTWFGPKDDETGEGVYERIRSTEGDTVTIEGECLPVDGDPFPVEIDVTVLTDADGEFDGAVGMVHDVTELREARRRLADQRHRFTYLVDNLPDAVVGLEYVDGEPVVRSVNSTFEDVFGYPAEEVVGSSIDDYVLGPHDHEEARALNRRAEASDEIQTEVRRLTETGARHFLLRFVPYEETDLGVRSFAIYTDITERKRREESLRVINRVLRHNLRHDLTVLAGYGDYVASEADDEDLVEAGEHVHDAARELENIGEKGREIQSALAAGRAEHTTVDLVAAVEDVVAEVARDHPSASVSTDLPNELFVECGPRIDEAIENVVENGIVHNDGTPTIEIRLRERDGWAEIRVSDDGPGIPEPEREVVTGRRAITQLEHASGLGLWLVKWIVEGYGGLIDFGESDLGGTAVTIRLPMNG